MKLCNSCLESLPPGNFRACVYTLDGLRGMCRRCENGRRRSRYASDAQYRTHRQKTSVAYQKSDRGKAVRARSYLDPVLGPLRLAGIKFRKLRYNHSSIGRRKRLEQGVSYYRISPENREKQVVRAIFHDSMASGIITKMPCEICGSPDVVGHHAEYRRSSACDVHWMCRKHHVDLHVWLRCLKIEVPVFIRG